VTLHDFIEQNYSWAMMMMMMMMNNWWWISKIYNFVCD